MKWLVVLVCVAVASGCQPVECDDKAVAGAVITVQDPDKVRLCEAIVTVHSQTEYEEELEVQDADGDCTYIGLYDRDGDFDITVTADQFNGFVEDRSITIEKDADNCHVKTVEKTITLEPL